MGQHRHFVGKGQGRNQKIERLRCQQPVQAPSQQPLAATAVSGNPFYPLILRDLPAPQPGEIEIERSDLKAVIPGKAFIVDQNQKTRTLEEGDPVYLGYVTRILPDQGKIECLLNKGGVSEKVEISIRLGQPIK